MSPATAAAKTLRGTTRWIHSPREAAGEEATALASGGMAVLARRRAAVSGSAGAQSTT
jgi:hypothetical protein